MGKLASEEHLWSACGLSTVDRSAPYYRRDGYWNGAVWMPYQWMFFKAALDAGKTGFAFRIADTALRLWQDECLSAPVAQWFAAYYVPGTLTTGFDVFVQCARWLPGNAGLEAELYCTRPGRTAVLAALAPGKMRISCRLGVAAEQRHAGLWEITLDVEQPGPVRLNLLPEGSCAE